MKEKYHLVYLRASQHLPLCCDFSVGALLACNVWFLSNVIATAVTAICKSEIFGILSNLISREICKNHFTNKRAFYVEK